MKNQGKMEEVSQFSIRLPQDVRRYLHEEANKKGRSLNYEIVQRLTKSVDMERASEVFIEEIENDLHPSAIRQARDQGLLYSLTESDTDELLEVLQEIRKINSRIDYLTSEKYSTNLFKMALRYFYEKSEK